MPADLATLLQTKTADALLTELLADLAAEGFPVTAWQSGNAGRTLAKVDARALASLYARIAEIARGGYLDLATGGWLTLLAENVFDTDRSPSVYMEATVVLTAASGAGPYNVAPGGLLVTTGTKRWRSTNTSNVVVPSGGSSDPITVKAESPGTGHNAPSSGLSIVTPAYAGLTVAAGTWPSVSGQDEESDASLRARCRARWSTLGALLNLDGYAYHATTCPDAPTVTRAHVEPGPGDGTLTVYVAQSSTAATSPQVAAVQAYLDGKKPVTDTPTVVAATAVPVTITGTVRVRSASYNTAANRTRASDAVAAYFASLGIGDDVDLGAIYAAIRSADGILDVDLSAPSGDTAISTSQIATLAYSITSGDWST